MNQPAPETADLYRPLISPGLVWKTMMIALAFAALTALLNVAGRWMGERIASGGHSIKNSAVIQDLRNSDLGREEVFNEERVVHDLARLRRLRLQKALKGFP